MLTKQTRTCCILVLSQLLYRKIRKIRKILKLWFYSTIYLFYPWIHFVPWVYRHDLTSCKMFTYQLRTLTLTLLCKKKLTCCVSNHSFVYFLSWWVFVYYLLFCDWHVTGIAEFNLYEWIKSGIRRCIR